MPPVVIGAGIAAAGAVGSAVIANKGAKSAAKAQAASADNSTAVQQQIYGENKATLAPYVQAGLPATQAINSFLGLTGQAQSLPTQQPNALAAYQGPYADSSAVGIGHETIGGDVQGPAFNSVGSLPGGGAQYAQTTQPVGVNGADAFKTFLGNSDYGFQFQQGGNAINSGYAGAGTLQSGAAMKALEDYRQNLQSGYRGEFLNALGNQQSVGLQAAGAQAGVSTNYANSLGQINQNKADALSNAALLKSQNIGNAINGATSSIAYMLGKK